MTQQTPKDKLNAEFTKECLNAIITIINKDKYKGKITTKELGGLIGILYVGNYILKMFEE